MDSVFLLLHNSSDNSPVVVNVSQIEQIYKSFEHNETVIVFINNDDDMLVNESVERVYNMIEAKLSSKPIQTQSKKKSELIVEGNK